MAIRQGHVIKTAGFDGEYGKIGLFTPDELKNSSGQLSFLDEIPLAVTECEPTVQKNVRQEQEILDEATRPKSINAEQLSAATGKARVIAVIAGPGTGKTFTLVERIARLVERGVRPEEITAVTFTVRAAAEMRERLAAKIKRAADKITVGTFHSICYSYLKDEYTLADRAFLLKTSEKVVKEFGLKLTPQKFINLVSAHKNGKTTEFAQVIAAYNAYLAEAGALDFDDLIAKALERGQTEFIYGLTGLSKLSSGKLTLDGKDITHESIRQRAKDGMGHIPEDRHKHGLVLDFSLENNIVLQRYWQPEFQKGGFIRADKVREYSDRLIEQYDVRSGQGSLTTVRSMSGGNQQKAIIAREIDRDPKLLVAVQPTRGLDVGAIEYIHRQIVAERDKGKAVLLVSLELDEVMNLSDRILVMYEGEIVGEFDPKATTVQELGLYMAGARKQGKEEQ